jgi:hypothetical protein
LPGRISGGTCASTDLNNLSRSVNEQAFRLDEPEDEVSERVLKVGAGISRKRVTFKRLTLGAEGAIPRGGRLLKTVSAA